MSNKIVKYLAAVKEDEAEIISEGISYLLENSLGWPLFDTEQAVRDKGDELGLDPARGRVWRVTIEVVDEQQ